MALIVRRIPTSSQFCHQRSSHRKFLPMVRVGVPCRSPCLPLIPRRQTMGKENEIICMDINYKWSNYLIICCRTVCPCACVHLLYSVEKIQNVMRRVQGKRWWETKRELHAQNYPPSTHYPEATQARAYTEPLIRYYRKEIHSWKPSKCIEVFGFYLALLCNKLWIKVACSLALVQQHSITCIVFLHAVWLLTAIIAKLDHTWLKFVHLNLRLTFVHLRLRCLQKRSCTSAGGDLDLQY